MLYRNLLRPLIFRIGSGDPEEAHEKVMDALVRLGESPRIRAAIRAFCSVSSPRLEKTVFGVRFPNPVGLAGGFDKNGIAIQGLAALGFGYLEVGSVTHHPQPGNPRPRVFRLPQEQALINRFGFNNEGAEALAGRLARLGNSPVPLGISLGKSKVTPLEEAVDDYLFSFRALYAFGDYFAVNVSSPNTPGLRQLQDRDALDTLLSALNEESHRMAGAGAPRPILVKVAPDLEWDALDDLLDVCTRRQVSGIIATNTTLSRSGVHHPVANEAGGLSGAPLCGRALKVVQHIRRQLPRLPIIGTGGILEPSDALAMLDNGADLVQIYTGLIYSGPLLVRDINRHLKSRYGG